MSIRLLCVGDIHLGRRPVRLTPELLEVVEIGELTPGRAWLRTVDTALRLAVDGVLLAGDTVDDEHDFFEAYGHLARGVERLVEAGVQVLAVAGNHDVQILPRLADAIPSFRLVGRGGAWESVLLEGRDGSRLRLVGWSFPTREVRSSPLASLPGMEQGDLPVVGLLHCDRDGGSSRYAPVRSSELLEAGFDAFLLGHVHKPDRFEDGRRIGYLGSLCGLNPNETGVHGPCLLEVGGDGVVSIERVPLAPLWWERLDLDVTDLSCAEDLGGRITARIEQLHQEVGRLDPGPRAVGLEIRLLGRTALRRDLERWLRLERPRELVLVRNDTAYFVQKVHHELRPAVDLSRLAEGGDPAALLAQQILILERAGDPRRADLTRRAGRRLEQVLRRQVFGSLGRPPLDEEQAALLLKRAAITALDELLAQKETP
ncbi:MAG: DNA repair exonuclease [Planctomycetota bacterium]